ncbi:MAG: undecaprenyl/decaprenyl-phosphate alpha-N-acetylglucosaminyl 1-phosphate transferase, partial [Muribaculaceae bacterium]|nr:undecaprenyl/decaprenyl-phosphate alpha-N-acetylglucosaminyl 1-phosphate transferase [Muribaculaceae bacterium]
MNNWLIDNILTFAFGFAAVACIIPQILFVAHKLHLFDSTGERKIHSGAVPRLGGVSFAPSIIFAVLLVLALTRTESLPEMIMLLKKDVNGMFLLFCGMICMFMVGIADDLVEVRYRTKFIFQIIVGILIARAGILISNLDGFLGITLLPDWIAWALTILIIVYIMNSFNLIDGIDGLSGTLTLIPVLFYGYVCYSSGHYIYSMITFAAGGCLLPFLYYNIFGSVDKHKKIFMGDTGALTNGLVLAFMGIEVTNIENYGGCLQDVKPIIMALSPLVVPMFDQLRVFFHRIVRRRNHFLPDKCHIHHKLLYMSLSTRATLVVILIIALLFIALNLFLSAIPLGVTWIVLIDFIVWTIGNMILTSAIRRRERRR